MTSASRNTGIGIAALVVLAGLLLANQLRDRRSPEQQAVALLRQATRLAARGESQQAEVLARQAIERNGGLSTAYRLAAECAAQRNDYDQALNDLSHISKEDVEDWIIARQLAADVLHNRVYRFREAERAYRDVLGVRPDDVFANEGYARLLGLCGRRTEAIPHVLQLVRAGRDTDLLMLLSRESGALDDPELLEAARKADPADPNPLLGQAQAAEAIQDEVLALEKLREASRLSGLPSDFHGRLGRQLLANRRFDELQSWARSIPENSQSAEGWLVRAELAERAGDRRGAIRCYWEAAKLRPESLHANNQLARQLTAASRSEAAEPFLQRVRKLNELRERQQRTIMSDEKPRFSDVFAMIRAYESVGRLWEAFAWGRLALEIEPRNADLLRLLQTIEPQLAELPLELTAREYNPARQIDLSEYPVPSLETQLAGGSVQATSKQVSFQQQRAEIGFDFRYFDGTSGTTRRMFEFGGGGIAVVDFDKDGLPDLFCTQGRKWDKPNTGPQEHHDRLYRNHRGQAFVDASQDAAITAETGFGQGVSAGDVNNDGFPDLYVANTGINTLWLNNGDGTFSDHSASIAGQTPRWTTSCLIADLNGDTFPDLYDVNYLAGDDVFDRLCTHENGDAIMCTPFDFEPAVDRVWLGDGAGGFRDRTNEFLRPPPNGKGLGVAVLDVGNRRLSLFVANDTTPNFFYTAESASAASLSDTAMISGLAFNSDGLAEACMGVAVGDCSQDGRLDLLVTNFLYESNTLYSPIDERLYEDKTREAGLYDASLPVLGFGTQFLDANLDGRLELFVTNGHTQDLSKYGTPYKMPPQVFEWTGKRFEQLPADQLGPWSAVKAVGRAVARLDWNGDGKSDLVVGLLDEPSFVLTNTSQTSDNRSLTLQLIATESARDAVGATVTASIGDTTRLHQLTAGDGFQCSNERLIQMGCGPADQIERLTVLWPSGAVQEFRNVPTSRRYTLIEGRELVALSEPSRRSTRR